MNEATKTLIYVAIAAGVAAAAYATRPVPPSLDPTDDVGEQLYAEFTDASTATSLEILKFDDETGEVHPFKVEVVDGVWTIPSHFNYPADSENRLGEVATSVIGLEKLSIATDIPGDHELFGVLDPSDSSSGAVGVGTRLTLLGESGDKLVDLIIGKEVKDQTGVRYVRLPEQNRVYTTAVDPDQWTTKFEDWIEGDLLKLNSFDVTSVFIDDYSVDTLNGRIVPGAQMDLTYDDTAETKWTLTDLAEGEELDTTKLNGMTRALDELKIVDVRRKPAGLSGTLRASEDGLAITPAAIQSLQSKGFYISQSSLVSNKGQIVCQMKDGVEYVLRFGEIAVGTEKSDGDDSDEDDDAQSAEDDTTAAEGDDGAAEGENRYLFVMAQFNEGLLEQPELTPLPGEEPPAAEPTDEDETGPAEPDAEADEEPVDAIAAEEERAEIEAENKRLLDEFGAKVDEGKERVKELNDRFADWYYVISNETYDKIHLSREDIIKQPEAEADVTAGPDAAAVPAVPQGDTLEAFEALKDQAPGQ